MNTPALPPLSHHDILGLIAPYTQAGWQVDLAASDRLARKLLFRPAQPQPLPETLMLEGLATGSWQLTRTTVHASGEQAHAQAIVQDLAEQGEALLAAVVALPQQRHFSSGPGFIISRHYRCTPRSQPVLESAQIRCNGPGPALVLAMTISAVRGVAAEITLAAPQHHLKLPQDLLAVLGWHWTRLVPAREGWRTRLRLRGGPAQRTAAAEQALGRAAEHLSQTLVEPPPRFHERHARARFGVMLRRAIPLATPLVLVATIVLMPRLDAGAYPGPFLLLYHLPTLLILLSFRLQELPTLAPPPWPRRSTATNWLAPL